MCLLRFPTEIRLRIYSELLIQDDPIRFGADFGPCNPSLICRTRKSLCPSLLRVNKTINREAIPLLYSSNRFRFPDAYTSSTSAMDHESIVPYIAPFLRRIGENTHLLRHICINFLSSFSPWKPPVLHESYSQVLQLIRETCIDLRTIEMTCGPDDAVLSVDDIDDIDFSAAMLKAVDDGGLKDMSSLERVVVVLQQYGIDEEDIAGRERLMQRMPSPKWCIELKDMGRKIWISIDDRCEFDNYEDCQRYDDEYYIEEMKREEEKEEEAWRDEYIRRRNDPYWKNDSDYD
ncbi:hypothetical protein O1611_g1813 [Lasiodiplodia mahajangana]|uniref:Uncharacterized protein n=1 Tax=Lasiodiplodia mahajangana TaxID=1108764 RepID=A0ACC2JWD9_9PEZI|nr:hypothetical protein O1611_g1813 [Lasiodiplodia mahajangana]